MKKLGIISILILLVGSLGACATTDTTNNTKKVVNLSNSSQVVYFDFDEDEIKATEQEKIINQANAAKSNEQAEIIVDGHTDYLGTDEYNIALGERRGNAIKESLVEQGVDESSIKVRSYGKNHPVDPRRSSDARAKNRRTETRLQD